MRSIFPYLAALGLSVALLVAGALADGVWDYASLIWMAIVVAVLDQILPGPNDGPTEAQATALTTGLALVHFPLLILVVWALAQGGEVENWLAYFAASGLFFGQIMNSNAHELIHAGGRARRGLGRWTYITLLFGHQTTAHPGIHHTWVATPEDPNTSRYNESWWRFVVRAWRDSFTKGLTLEKSRQVSRGRAPWDRRNPYWGYLGGTVLSLAVAFALGEIWGVLAFVALCAFAQSQLLITDYVLHYGMRRRWMGEKWEPVGPQHSWNAPHVVTNLLTLHAPRHSDHHAHPSRGFEALRVEESQPQLPYSLPVMVTIALWPRAWRKVMNPRVDALGQTSDAWDKSAKPTPDGEMSCA
ncbi:MAG: alkane 1-monooxygenase [Pseudomonadota bacterium]